MEAFLQRLLPRLLPSGVTFQLHAFQGKPDLMKKLPARLKGYAHWLPEGYRILVLLDRDGDDCEALRKRPDHAAKLAGLAVRNTAIASPWRVVNRIAIEELEAWYFGDWEAVCRCFPRVNINIPKQRDFRNPDKIKGGTWEAFHRILLRAGYFRTGLRKIEVARALGAEIDPVRNTSPSFQRLRSALEHLAN